MNLDIKKMIIFVKHTLFKKVIWEAEIMRISVRGQHGQIVPKTCISKIARTKWTGGEV
jgi:hypothetical protein